MQSHAPIAVTRGQRFWNGAAYAMIGLTLAGAVVERVQMNQLKPAAHVFSTAVAKTSASFKEARHLFCYATAFSTAAGKPVHAVFPGVDLVRRKDQGLGLRCL
jgi:hypothetical protein